MVFNVRDALTYSFFIVYLPYIFLFTYYLFLPDLNAQCAYTPYHSSCSFHRCFIYTRRMCLIIGFLMQLFLINEVFAFC